MSTLEGEEGWETCKSFDFMLVKSEFYLQALRALVKF